MVGEMILRNERGFAALLSTVVVSLALVLTLSSVYIYLMNRNRQQAQIREAYKLVNVTEEAEP